MTAAAPDRICIDGQVLTVLRALLACAAPEEGCALLLGVRQGSGWGVRRVWPCRNVWPRPEQRQRFFAVDPREQLLAQRWGRQRGLEVLGAAHSHPQSAPVPSASDLRLCLRPALAVICGADGDCRAWWLPDSGPQQSARPRQLPWKMDDQPVPRSAAGRISPRHASS